MMRTETKLKIVAAAAGAFLTSKALRRRRRISFRGRSVVITGGSRGLGLLLARELASEGANLTLLARDQQELAIAEDELRRRYKVDVLAIPCDLTVQADLEGAIERAHSRFGRIDVLINNAGIIQSGPIDHMSLADFDDALRIHLWAPLYSMSKVVPIMRRQRGGRIVNISSIGGRVAVPHLVPYSASKFALVGLSNGMRAELAKDNILVTTVCPGLMRTGSPVHALFKGKHKAEFTAFAISDSLPGITVDARRAARQIIEACRHGDARLTISAAAKIVAAVDALCPSVVASAFALVNRMLPGPTGPEGNQARRGADCQTPLAPSVLTRLSDVAAYENNEVTAIKNVQSDPQPTINL